MRILWMGDCPTVPSGFGNVARFVCAGLADRGHQVSILRWQKQGQPTPWHNCTLYPVAPWYECLSNPSGANTDQLLNYLRQLQPDVLITLADIWWLAYLANSTISDFLHTAGIPWALYCPIDSDMGENRLPPSWVRILKSVDLPIAMSCYGHDVAQANGVESAYIPHGVDTKVFQPPVDKELAKQALGYEGKFVILSDARNQPRKMLPRTLEIFRRFANDKNDVILHLHCDPNDPLTRSDEYSYDLQSDIAFLNLTKKVYLTKDMSMSKGTGLPIEELAQIYQAADVHLLASLGEGFGLPTLQAAAAGVVPLASNYTASRELVLNHGEAISIRHFLFNPFGLGRGLIDIEEAVSKLETLYTDRELLASKAQSAREFALSYDWERIVPQWEELLQHEVPRIRTSLRASVNASVISHTSSDLEPRESKASELMAELRQDVRLEQTLRIPVTLPLIKSKQRIIGYVYVASQRDVPTALALGRIFPGLHVWSTIPLDFSSSLSNGTSPQTKVVQANSPEYRPHLALSTLALDTGNFDPRLPIEAAKLGVPCIGLTQQREQILLWPDLSLDKPDPIIAAELGRQMLTDQGVAADLCLAARQRLASALIESELQVH